MKTHLLEECPTCGAPATVDLEFGGHSLHRCPSCDTVFAAEYADPSEIYVDGYLTGGTDFGLDLRDPNFQDYLSGVGARRARMIERITGGRGRLLDVGCGTGEFSEAAQQLGFEVQAVEPEASGAEVARSRGVDVRTSLLEESGLPERSYDVVTAFHVLEHLPDSRAFLQLLARWARPGSHVVVEVPNFRSIVRRRAGEEWVHLRPLEHLIYHSPTSLRRALVEGGLQPVAVKTPTWLSPPQTLDQALTDLAEPPLRAVLKPLSQKRDVKGETALLPGRAAWAVLRGVGSVYGWLKVGMVVLGVARVPAGRT